MRKFLILATSMVLLVAACSDSNGGGTTGTTGASGGSGGSEAELTVSAAS